MKESKENCLSKGLKSVCYFFTGIISFIIKLHKIDFRVAFYLLFNSSNPPRILYISLFITFTSYAITLFKNPSGAYIIGAVVLVLIIEILYAFTEAPPLRWHIIQDTISIQYQDDTDQKISYTERIIARSIKKNTKKITYPINFSGDLDQLSVLVGGVEIHLKSTQESQEQGFYVNPGGLGFVEVEIEFDNPIKFGRQVDLTVKYELTNADENCHVFTANTLVDRVIFEVYFHRDRYPTEIHIFESFGVEKKSCDNKFIPQRRALNSNILEKWEFEPVKFLHKYGFAWKLPPKQTIATQTPHSESGKG